MKTQDAPIFCALANHLFGVCQSACFSVFVLMCVCFCICLQCDLLNANLFFHLSCSSCW